MNLQTVQLQAGGPTYQRVVLQEEEWLRQREEGQSDIQEMLKLSWLSLQ
jgi:hypothetical protein